MPAYYHDGFHLNVKCLHRGLELNKVETVLTVAGIVSGNDLMNYRKSDASKCEWDLQNLSKRVLLLSNSPLTSQLGKTNTVKSYLCASAQVSVSFNFSSLYYFET